MQACLLERRGAAAARSQGGLGEQPDEIRCGLDPSAAVVPLISCFGGSLQGAGGPQAETGSHASHNGVASGGKYTFMNVCLGRGVAGTDYVGELCQFNVRALNRFVFGLKSALTMPVLTMLGIASLLSDPESLHGRKHGLLDHSIVR